MLTEEEKAKWGGSDWGWAVGVLSREDCDAMKVADCGSNGVSWEVCGVTKCWNRVSGIGCAQDGRSVRPRGWIGWVR